MKNYYYILGVTFNASNEQIKIAYYKLAQKFHPDKNDGDDFFEEHFKEIQEAYDTLSKPNKKDFYDSVYFSEPNLNNQRNGFKEDQEKGKVNFVQPIIVNGTRIDQIEMIFIEGGCLEMGGTHPNAHMPDRKWPTREVLVDDFFVGKYPVTQSQWLALMESETNSFLKIFSKASPVKTYLSSKCAIHGVSWEDAMLFVKKLNQLTGKKYCLPTDAEWEYSALGGKYSNGYLYSGGNDLDKVGWSTHNSSVGRSNYATNNRPVIHPVGLKDPNELGIYDMSGNVFEYCSTDYNENKDYKILKGGAYLFGRWDSEIKNAKHCHKDKRESTHGFRLALNVKDCF